MDTKVDEHRGSAGSLRRTIGCAIPLLVVGALAFAFWFMVIHPRLQHRRTVERVEDVVKSLEDRCPKGVPPKHWYNAIGWTWNTIGNCLCVREFLVDDRDAEEKFSRFADELEQRAQGAVGPEIIIWFWDEVERLSKNGKWYSDRFRPVKDGRLVDPGNSEWTGIPESSTPFVSTAGSRVFHKLECPLVVNLNWRQRSTHYSSREAALQCGMQPCPECNP